MAFRYRGDDIDPQAVGKELGVRAVLTGRVVQQGDSLNVLAELVSVEDGRQLWGQQYQHKLEELVFVQNNIAMEISQALRLQLTGEEQQQLVETTNSAAYEAYLKGRNFWSKRTAKDLENAVTFFEQALAADPNYALAHVGVADSYLLLGAFYGNPGEHPTSVTMTTARTSARDALELDPNLAEAHTTLAYIELLHNWDWGASETEFLRAIELKPDYAPAHQWYSELLMVLGRHDEAIEESRRALELEPVSPIVARDHGLQLHRARRYEESIEQFRKTIELEPNFAGTRDQLADVFWDAGMVDEALAEAHSLDENRRTVLALVAQGKTAEAVEWIDALPKDARTATLLSYLYARAGDKDKSLEQLEEAVKNRVPNLPITLTQPVYDPWRSEPRLVELRRNMGLEP